MGVKMKISSIELKNVKCFKHEIIDMCIPETEDVLPVCILVGDNGAGKSTILKAIVAVMTEIDSKYAGELLKDSDIYYDADSLEVRLNFALNDDERKILDHPNRTSIEITYNHERGSNKDSFKKPKSIDQEKFKKIVQSMESSKRIGLVMYYDPFRFISNKNPTGPNLQLENDAKRHALQSNILFQGESTCRDLELKQWVVNMDYRRLKEPSYENMEVFNHMIAAFNELMSPLEFQYIDAQGTIIFKDKKESKDIPLDMLSDGFKSVFFIAIDIIRRLSLTERFNNEPFYRKEAIILIDEIDCHIHPEWQRKILSSMTKLFPGCQFIVTTHSPYVLDGMSEYSIKQIGEKKIE